MFHNFAIQLKKNNDWVNDWRVLAPHRDTHKKWNKQNKNNEAKSVKKNNSYERYIPFIMMFYCFTFNYSSEIFSFAKFHFTLYCPL